MFKGNRPLSDNLSGMQPSRGCSPSGRGRRGGWRPYGKGAVCLHWDLTAARRRARVYVQVNVQLVYVAVELFRSHPPAVSGEAALSYLSSCSQSEGGGSKPGVTGWRVGLH